MLLATCVPKCPRIYQRERFMGREPRCDGASTHIQNVYTPEGRRMGWLKGRAYTYLFGGAGGCTGVFYGWKIERQLISHFNVGNKFRNSIS